MSSTTVLGITPDRRPTELAEYRNAHGWAPSIWSRLVKHLYGFDGYLFHGEGEKHLDRLWQEIESQPEWVQAANVLTFDTGVIPGRAFGWAADMLDEFERRLPSPSTHVNHVPVLAALLRTLPEVPLLGVHGTSVTENPFDPWDAEADAPGSGIGLYDMYVLERHRSLVLPEADEQPNSSSQSKDGGS
jgi:hypothetical protein